MNIIWIQWCLPMVIFLYGLINVDEYAGDCHLVVKNGDVDGVLDRFRT